jgi:fructosamine-3-kinase
MTLAAAVERALGAALRDPVRRSRAVAGGDINQAYRVQHESGMDTFLKVQRGAPEGFFEAEAAGLEWLRVAEELVVPEVLGLGCAEGHDWLCLRWVSLELSRDVSRDERLGHALASLHRLSLPAFGAPADNFIGTLAQRNRAASTWSAFYAEERLAPHVRALSDEGLLGAAERRGLESLVHRLPQLFADEDDLPCRLHGDLWSGNAGADAAGRPVLFDPAVYAGHREMDLAMMRLFGGFGARVFAAYEESWPLSPGHAERVEVCQLYPLLAHARLFGGGYLGAVSRALRAW